MNKETQLYISKYDKSNINFDHISKRKKENQIHFELAPQPFWGNITDPKVIILYTNPGYKEDEVKQETLNSDIRNALLANLKGNPFDYLEFNKDNESYRWEHLHSANYWIHVFIEIKEETHPLPFSKYIGEFEYHSYPSRNHDPFKYKRKKEISEQYLPTQKVLFEYLNQLIIKTKPVVVIARAVNLWQEALPILNDYPIITFINPQSGVLSKKKQDGGNLEINDFNKVIDSITNNS